MMTNAAAHPFVRRRANAARKALKRGRASQILRTGRTLEASCHNARSMRRPVGSAPAIVSQAKAFIRRRSDVARAAAELAAEMPPGVHHVRLKAASAQLARELARNPPSHGKLAIAAAHAMRVVDNAMSAGISSDLTQHINAMAKAAGQKVDAHAQLARDRQASRDERLSQLGEAPKPTALDEAANSLPQRSRGRAGRLLAFLASMLSPTRKS